MIFLIDILVMIYTVLMSWWFLIYWVALLVCWNIFPGRPAGQNFSNIFLYQLYWNSLKYLLALMWGRTLSPCRYWYNWGNYSELHSTLSYRQCYHQTGFADPPQKYTKISFFLIFVKILIFVYTSVILIILFVILIFVFFLSSRIKFLKVFNLDLKKKILFLLNLSVPINIILYSVF